VAPTVREVTSWMLRRPDTLTRDEQAGLAQVRAHCPELDAAARYVAAFAEMMCGRHGDRLDTWLAAVEADTLEPLHRFAAGLRRDYDAVRAGLTLEHNSGRVEGTVNKIKMLKRQNVRPRELPSPPHPRAPRPVTTREDQSRQLRQSLGIDPP
jgi:transposase